MSVLYRHIACCVDHSPAAEMALAEARRVRAHGPGRLSLVHVYKDPTWYPSMVPVTPDFTGLKEGAQAWLEQLSAGVPGSEAILLEGFPAHETCEWAAHQHVDLLVAGAHHGPARRAVLGSFTSYLLHHAPCPVLVVHPQHSNDD